MCREKGPNMFLGAENPKLFRNMIAAQKTPVTEGLLVIIKPFGRMFEISNSNPIR